MANEDRLSRQEVRRRQGREKRSVAQALAVQDGDGVDGVGGGVGEDVVRRATRIVCANEGLGEGRGGVNRGVERVGHVAGDRMLRRSR